MDREKTRQSNIELLRILAAEGVIILHYNNAGMGGGFLYVEPWSINQLVMTFLESIFVCAVNLFILISGFYMSKKKRADLIKPLSLIAQVIIYALLFYATTIIIGARKFILNAFVSCFIPDNWFVILYSALFVISPYINQFLDSISANAKLKLICVMGAVFSLYPTLVDCLSLWTGKEFLGLSTLGMYGSQDGYTIVNFFLLYIIGNALRDIQPGQQRKQVLQLTAVILLIFGWALLDNAMLHQKHSSWAYCNPLVVIEAVLIFQIVRNIHINHNAIINRLAGASFSAYILHTKVIGHIKIADWGCGRNPGPNEVINRRRSRTCIPTKND